MSDNTTLNQRRNKRAARRTLALIAAGWLAAAAVAGVPPAHADPANCETIAWPDLLHWAQKRTVCDGPQRADGSWDRHRILWTPAHQVPFTCSYGRYYSSCSGGYFVGDTIAADDTYPCWPDNIPANEPGHLGFTPGFVA